MKKILFSIAVFALVASSANAQLTVYSNGHVGVATSDSIAPSSTFAVGVGWDGYGATVFHTQRGICGISNGKYLNWAYGVYGRSLCPSALYQCGVEGVALVAAPQSSGRTYGVKGLAGNATSGWNYGIYGQLNGTSNGAGVYGTSTSGENGSYVDGRYAGYFNGATKVNGNLTVTGSINGVVLSKVSNASAPAAVSSVSDEYERMAVTDKLSTLSATRYYTEAPVKQVALMEGASDTVSVAAPVNEIQKLSAERSHYGLDVEQLKESFPELVYEQEDGTVSVNYMELIPILVQAINNLSTEVKVLKASGAYSDRQTSGTTTTINLSTNGKVIGTKRTSSK